MRARTLNGIGRVSAQDVGTAAGSAVGTAIAPGIGTAIGGAVGAFVASLFPGPSTDWASAGPGVHDWFTRFGPQVYLDYAKAHPELGILSSVDRCRDGLIGFCWMPGSFGPSFPVQNGFVVTPNADGISLLEAVDWYTERTPRIYQAMGVDYSATLAKIEVNVHTIEWTSNRSNVVMLPGAGTADAPAPIADALDAAADAVLNGSATKEQKTMVEQSLEAENSTRTASVPIIPLLLLGAIVFAANK